MFSSKSHPDVIISTRNVLDRYWTILVMFTFYQSVVFYEL